MAVFTVIDHTEIGTGGAATWAVSSISASYDHLFLLSSIRTERSGFDVDVCDLQVGNGSLDTGGNYSYIYNQTTGGTPKSWRSSGTDGINRIVCTGLAAEASVFSCNKIWIPGYASAKFKQIIVQSIAQSFSTVSGEWELDFTGGLWQSTSAITDIGMHVNGGSDIAEFSTFTLYGVTGV